MLIYSIINIRRKILVKTSKKRKKIGQKLLKLFVACLVIGTLGIAVLIGYNISIMSKDPLTLDDISASKATIIYDKYGEEFETLKSDRGTKADSFPKLLQNAVVAVEDKRFYMHNGFDPIRIGKAFLDTLKNQKFGAGGSTITQQLVKNVTGDDEVSINRKVREVLYALSIEQNCSKEEILTRYLNIIYLGHGNYGMVDAIKMYFGKTPEELTVAEAAFMAAIVKSPETYIKDLDRANDRKNLILGYMLEQKKISQEEYEKAKDEYVEIELSSKSGNVNSWFTDSAISSLAGMMSESYQVDVDEAFKMIYRGGYKIYSTVDPSVQSELYSKYRNLPDSIGNVQSASVVLSKYGEVIAIVGGTGKKTGNLLFNRATQARRQPGSSIKPLAVYGPAFEEGVINALSSYEDKAVSYSGWTPKNYYEGYKGFMSIRNAIATSNNSIAVQVLNDVNSSTGISYLQKMGFKTNPNDNALTLALGAVDTGYTPVEMASGYQCFSNGGMWCEPIFYTRVETNDGNIIYDCDTMQEKKQVYSPETAFIITDMLKSVVEWDNGTARNMAIEGVEVAAKTGTTTENKDKWICSYTSNYVVCSWYGYDTPKNIDVSSKFIQQTACSILKETVKADSFKKPETVSYYYVCKSSGSLATENCGETFIEVFDTTKTLPTPCSSCQASVLDSVQEDIKEEANNLLDYFGGFFTSPTENYSEPETQSEEYFEEETYYEEEYSEVSYEYEEVIT